MLVAVNWGGAGGLSLLTIMTGTPTLHKQSQSLYILPVNL